MARKTNLQKLCEDFNVTRQYVRELVKNGIIPAPNSRGAYDYRKCVRSYIEHLRKQSGRMVDPDKRNLDLEERSEKIRLLKIKNDKLEKEKEDAETRGNIKIADVANNLDKIMLG